MLRTLLIVLSNLADYRAVAEALRAEAFWGAINAAVFMASPSCVYLRGFALQRMLRVRCYLEDSALLN